jgi:hypothetical protein
VIGGVGRYDRCDQRDRRIAVSPGIHALLSVPAERERMSFEKEDEVVLHDKHSEYDGETGTITQVMETMFGDATYTVSFEDGQETGVPEDSLDAAEGDDGDENNDSNDSDE